MLQGCGDVVEDKMVEVVVETKLSTARVQRCRGDKTRGRRDEIDVGDSRGDKSVSRVCCEHASWKLPLTQANGGERVSRVGGGVEG